MIDKSRMIPVELLGRGESEVGIELIELSEEARGFLLAQRWCASVRHIFYDRGFPKMAVFFAEIEPLENADPRVWVIVGDIPPLYLDTEDHQNGAEALLGYWLAFAWMIELYNRGLPLEECPPLLTRYSLEPLKLNRDLTKQIGSHLPYIRQTTLELFGGEIRLKLKGVDITSVRGTIAEQTNPQA
jgi:hypothetical protein